MHEGGSPGSVSETLTEEAGNGGEEGVMRVSVIENGLYVGVV